MTPQESDLVNELFGRLAKLETTPRDAAAERLVADGLRQAPHALYALVQTVLLQDEALKRANARIEELEADIDTIDEQERQRGSGGGGGSFLDSMRNAITGGGPRGSVPNVRGEDYGPERGRGEAQYAPQMPPPGYGGGPAYGAGGSFLGTAAATTVGMLGSSLLLNGIRSMFGHQFGGHNPQGMAHLPGSLGSPAPAPGGKSDGDILRELDKDGGGHKQEAADHKSAADADAQKYNVADDDNDDMDDDNVDDDDDDDYVDDDGDGDSGDSYET